MKLKNNNIDIFCQVVDNFGDAGFSFRLAKFLKRTKPQRQIRLFINELKTLAQIIPGVNPERPMQNIEGVDIIVIIDQEVKRITHLQFASLAIESLSSPIPEVIRKHVHKDVELIITLEHLSGEKIFESMHGLPVPNRQGIPRYLMAQGFSNKSAGILIEPNIQKTINDVNNSRQKWRNKFLQPYSSFLPSDLSQIKMGSIFSYEHDFEILLTNVKSGDDDMLLIVLGDQSQVSMKTALQYEQTFWLSEEVAKIGNNYLVFPELMPQEDYDNLLMVMDFNFVRGEDSLARAILSGKPFLWHSYDQGDNYQLVKVEAFLEVLIKCQDSVQVFTQYVQLMRAYNWRKTKTDNDPPPENYFHFFKNFATIHNWINKLRQDLILQGGLIPCMEQFIESI